MSITFSNIIFNGITIHNFKLLKAKNHKSIEFEDKFKYLIFEILY